MISIMKRPTISESEDAGLFPIILKSLEAGKAAAKFPEILFHHVLPIR